jgi:PAS domain S-box-containing protein
MIALAEALERIARAASIDALLAESTSVAAMLLDAEVRISSARPVGLPRDAVLPWVGRDVPRSELGLQGEGSARHALVVRLPASDRWLVAARSGGPFDEARAREVMILGALASQAERALEQAEAARAQQSIYRTLVEQLPTTTYYRKLDAPGGDAWFVSPQVRELLGLEPDAILSNPEIWRSMLHPDDREWVLKDQPLFDPIRRTTPVEVEYRMVRTDGRVIWVQNTALAVRDAAGRAEFVLGVLADVTQRRETEEALRQSLKREAVARLAAGVAHDFNNVLAAILAYASLLREEVSEDAEKRRALEEIETAAKRGYELTRELSAIARPEATRPAAPEATSPDPDEIRAAPVRAGEGEATILLVDDDDAVRRATTAILARRGYRVLAVSSGLEALALLEKAEPVDLLLTDVIMPAMGGRELAERARLCRGDLKIAFISGFTDDEVLKRSLESADWSLLQKPFSANELLAHVRSSLTANK